MFRRQTGISLELETSRSEVSGIILLFESFLLGGTGIKSVIRDEQIGGFRNNPAAREEGK